MLVQPGRIKTELQFGRPLELANMCHSKVFTSSICGRLSSDIESDSFGALIAEELVDGEW